VDDPQDCPQALFTPAATVAAPATNGAAEAADATAASFTEWTPRRRATS